MIPVEHLTPPRVRATSNGFSVRFHPIYALNVTKRSALCVVPGNLGSSSRSSALCVSYSSSKSTLLSFRFPPPNNFNLNSPRRGRAWKGTTDVRRMHGSPAFSSPDGAATGTTAASPDDFSSQSPEDLSPSWTQQNSSVPSSLSEREEELLAIDAENSGKDDGGGRVQRTTTVLKEGGQEGGPETVVQEVYTLTEEGTLSTVSVTRGEKTRRTITKMDRVLAEVGNQAESLQNAIQNKVQTFSLRKFIKDWGKKDPELEDLKFNAAVYRPVEGISNISQWTATELTLQRAQLLRISKDAMYLVWAFSLFGGVRVLEAVASVFASSPPDPWKLKDCMNALDPLTVASLAHALRKPIVGMLEVDPTNLEEVSILKSKFWTELHKFYERQWKVIATLGVARLFSLIVAHLPKAEWVTTKVKMLWDVTMALPIF